MSELVERTWSWCLRYGDAAAALVLTASGAASLAAGGLMSTPAKLACSICLLGVTVLITWRRRQPIAVSVTAGAL